MEIDLFTYLGLILKIGCCRRAQLTGEVPHHNVRTSQSQKPIPQIFTGKVVLGVPGVRASKLFPITGIIVFVLIFK
jgi:hypothetical protein